MNYTITKLIKEVYFIRYYYWPFQLDNFKVVHCGLPVIYKLRVNVIRLFYVKFMKIISLHRIIIKG